MYCRTEKRVGRITVSQPVKPREVLEIFYPIVCSLFVRGNCGKLWNRRSDLGSLLVKKNIEEQVYRIGKRKIIDCEEQEEQQPRIRSEEDGRRVFVRVPRFWNFRGTVVKNGKFDDLQSGQVSTKSYFRADDDLRRAEERIKLVKDLGWFCLWKIYAFWASTGERITW